MRIEYGLGTINGGIAAAIILVCAIFYSISRQKHDSTHNERAFRLACTAAASSASSVRVSFQSMQPSVMLWP